MAGFRLALHEHLKVRGRSEVPIGFADGIEPKQYFSDGLDIAVS